jgi:hypothetical protein
MLVALLQLNEHPAGCVVEGVVLVVCGVTACAIAGEAVNKAARLAAIKRYFFMNFLLERAVNTAG